MDMRGIATVLIGLLLTSGAARGAISTSPGSLSFAYQIGGSAPAAQTLGISSGPSPTVAFAVTTTSGNWITVNPTSGNSPATLTVSVDPAALASAITSDTGLPFEPGIYGGSISIAVSGQSTLGIPITVNVSGTY